MGNKNNISICPTCGQRIVEYKHGLNKTLVSCLWHLHCAGGRARLEFAYGGDPFTFRVVIEFIAGGASVKNCGDIYKTIMQTKNLRSWLETITAKIETDNATPNMASRFGYEETICVYPKGT